MSSCSDDTDVLLLIPPDVFAVPDVAEGSCCSGGNILSHIQYLEDKLRHLETNVLITSMRRFGSVDALTTTSRSQYNPRSLQNTPLKLKNMLNSEPYVSQKLRDEERLREIDEYFRQRQTEKREKSADKRLELSEVKKLLLEVEQTQKAVLGKLSLDDCFGDSSVSEECSSRRTFTTRRALSFDSPTNDNIDTVRERNDAEVNGEASQKQIVTVNSNLSCDMTSGENKDLQSMCPETFRQTPYEQQQVLRQRLEEERCRRQHCEGLIRTLQKSLLEGEEKLAVALNIDQEKDLAIRRLRDGWAKIMEHWKSVDDQNKEFSEKINEERLKFMEEKETLISSVKRYENELSKALDLAHGYKEKCESAVKDLKTAVREKETIRFEFEKVQEQLRSLEETVMKLNDVIAKKEEALNQSHAKVSELVVHVKELKKQLKVSLVDKERLQQEKSAKVALQNKLEEALKRELKAQEQIRSFTKSKADLKQYYQDQVERIVDEKQKEFQGQLLSAEKTLQKQLEGKERALEELARQQIQQLSEKHKIEVALIEEKHCQEIKLCEIRLAQSNQKIEELQKLIAERACYQQELTEKLHGVMENQWKETLRVISSTKSLNQNSESSEQPTLSRQNTFTLSEQNQVGKSEPSRDSCNVRKRGSMTYRIDETPQKISSEPNLKDYIDQLLQQRSFETDDSLATSHLETAATSNQFTNTVDSSTYSKDSSKYCSASSKPPWKG